MPHAVFVSYSSADRTTAEAVCASLEAAGIPCWIAPRDALPGNKYQGSIVRAIRNAQAMVFIFSSRSNGSEHVFRELHTASEEHKPIVPFRIEDVAPSDDFYYYISSLHWLDAITPPLEAHIERLIEVIRPLMTTAGEPAPTGASAPESLASGRAVTPARRARRVTPAAWGLVAATLVVAGFGVLNVSRMGQSAPPAAGTDAGTGVETSAPASREPAAETGGAPAAELAVPAEAEAGAGASGTTPPAPAPRTARGETAASSPAPPLSMTRVLVLVRADNRAAGETAEGVLSQEMLAAGYDVVDADAAAGVAADPGVSAGQTGAIARLGQAVGAGTILVAETSADAQSSLPGMFTGSATVMLKVYATASGRLLATERFAIGTAQTPGELGPTATAAASAAVRAASYQSARAAVRHLERVRAGG